MFVFVILLTVIFAVGAVVALIRGLLAFVRAGDLIKGGDDHLKRNEQQNKMMTQRVLFQALAVLAVTVLGLLFSRQ